MDFDTLTGYFGKLQETSSRDDMIDILSNLFEDIDREDLDIVCYLSLGRLAAGYQEVKLGVGDELVKGAISRAAGVNGEEVEKSMRELGDLGEVAHDVISEDRRDVGGSLDLEGKLSVKDVHEGLIRISKAQGSGSQERKMEILADLLAQSTKREGMYIVRLAVGEMRLGVGDMTVLDGLADAYLGSKEERPPLEHAYNISSDIGEVAKVLDRSGLPGVKRMRVSINRPLRPMLAQRVDKISQIMDKMRPADVGVEEKYDGERIQAHKNGEQVTLYSRRLNDVTHQFPDVVDQVAGHVQGEKAIVDGEVVAYDFQNEVYYPFQKLMERRRKYDMEEYADKIPVKYMAFDILYLNGKSILGKGYPERRKALEDVLSNHKYIAVTNRAVVSETEELEDFFQECLDRGLEGVVCKSCAKGSKYRAGAREWSWIKWKEEYATELSDTLDLVVVGAYSGKGSRGGTYGALLCAVYNHDRDLYQTLCKLGTGFTDQQLEELPEKLKDAETEDKPSRLDVTDEMAPHKWFEPEYVLEVKGAEITESGVHTCGRGEPEERGLGLRFPRFMRWRPDKKANQATTDEEVRQLSVN